MFTRKDGIMDQNPKGSPKKYGLRMFIPPSTTDNDEYWRYVAPKCFAISTQLGSPTISLAFTMNPHWPDSKVLMGGNGIPKVTIGNERDTTWDDNEGQLCLLASLSLDACQFRISFK
jgi:hypothetical protein